MTKPLFVWAGGKNKMLKHYIPILPGPMEQNIKSYVEPFFGGGAMFIHIIKTYQPNEVYINDINSDIMSIYSSIKTNYDEFMTRLNDLDRQYIPLEKGAPTERGGTTSGRYKFFMDLRKQYAFDYKDWSKTFEAATLYFLMKTGFNGIFQINKNTGGRYGTPPGLLNQKDCVYDEDVLKWWQKNLQNVTILSGDWKNVPDIKDAFYFYDPPYRDSFADYGNSFSDKQLKELIEIANNKNKVFICNRDDEKGWFKENKLSMTMKTFDITYTAGRRKKKEDGTFEAKKAKEVLLYHMK